MRKKDLQAASSQIFYEKRAKISWLLERKVLLIHTVTLTKECNSWF